MQQSSSIRASVALVRGLRPLAVAVASTSTSGTVASSAGVDRYRVFRERILDLGTRATFDGRSLPAFEFGKTEWLNDTWLRYVAWELSELEFRYELFALDELLRAVYPRSAELHDISPQERRAQLFACWGGGDFKPDPVKPSPYSLGRKSTAMYNALRSFFDFMSVWPRSHEYLRVPRYGWSFGRLDELARMVWQFYVQTFFDYRRHYPPMPYICPEFPWLVSM